MTEQGNRVRLSRGCTSLQQLTMLAREDLQCNTDTREAVNVRSGLHTSCRDESASWEGSSTWQARQVVEVPGRLSILAVLHAACSGGEGGAEDGGVQVSAIEHLNFLLPFFHNVPEGLLYGLPGHLQHTVQAISGQASFRTGRQPQDVGVQVSTRRLLAPFLRS